MTTLAATQDHALSTQPSRAGAMPSRASAPPVVAGATSKRSLWAGRVISGVAVLFLGMDAAMKLIGPTEALEATAKLGWPVSTVFALGVTQLVCLALYLVPRTAPLGAILWTGYLGGAIATHVRVFDPLFSHILFPVYVAAFLWGGLFLRDARVRGLLAPSRQKANLTGQ